MFLAEHTWEVNTDLFDLKAYALNHWVSYLDGIVWKEEGATWHRSLRISYYQGVSM